MSDKQLFTLDSAVENITEKAKQAIEELKEVDTLLNGIQKADRTLSRSDLDRISQNAFALAAKYGRNVADYLNTVLDASRAGYQNADEIAELSLTLQSACDISDELAMQYIIAADKAFALNGSVKDLSKTLDGACSITDRHAVSMTQLAEGLSAVSSQAAISQMDLSETTAALATMLSVTGQSGTETGNAFSSILMYLQQMTGEINGETIDTKALKNYERACKDLGVSLSEVKNGAVQLKDPMQVLKELSEAYASLNGTDKRRTSLLDAVGGSSSQSEALDALLKNYGLYEEMLQDYAGGTGTLAAEAAKAAETWEGSLNRLSATWNETVGNLMDSDAIIAVVNSLNSLLSVIDGITDKTNILGTAGILSGLFMNAKGIGGQYHPSGNCTAPTLLKPHNNAMRPTDESISHFK